jgi:hypothetical protein
MRTSVHGLPFGGLPGQAVNGESDTPLALDKTPVEIYSVVNP